ncbi:Zinc finger Ran-binding domain-containing protein 2 [Camellia lanceoleosa]|uniref:Zinc finger Ran-binding domain-containing protein 2 n=1 Tax=Camellia lanceoleosa TaxID=1840588 RepID=A0ACC0I0X5_9ERIC|nr:Zinc finger Ran-binding domain-containing protein 2 [Camellia lanceoleosa]
MSREGDWICASSSCQHLNFKKRDSCQRCGCSKFGGGSEVSSYRTEVLAGDWYCNVINCGAHNYASRTSCHRCGASKHDYTEYVGSMMTTSGCAYDGCGLPGWKKGDWICTIPGCGAHNYASKMECYKCRMPRQI